MRRVITESPSYVFFRHASRAPSILKVHGVFCCAYYSNSLLSLDILVFPANSASAGRVCEGLLLHSTSFIFNTFILPY